MQKISLAIIIILALFLSHIVHPESNGPIYKAVLMVLMTIGFLWPFGLLISVKYLVKNKNKVTFKRKILMAGLFVLTMPLVSFSYVPPEGIFLFNSEIDTKFADNFSKSKFNKIHSGQTKDAVLRSLDEPISKITVENKNEYNEIWLYSSDGACTWHDFAWKRKQIHFKDNFVFETHTGWSYD